jgi:hypothetical protein
VRGKWHRDAKRLADRLFAASPFKQHRPQFKVGATGFCAVRRRAIERVIALYAR